MTTGQPLALKGKAGHNEIGVIDEPGPLAHEVTEIGDDEIVVRDETGVIECRIPVTAVRWVVVLTTKTGRRADPKGRTARAYTQHVTPGWAVTTVTHDASKRTHAPRQTGG